MLPLKSTVMQFDRAEDVPFPMMNAEEVSATLYLPITVCASPDATEERPNATEYWPDATDTTPDATDA